MTVRLPWSGPAQSYLHFYPGLPALLRAMQPDVIDLWEEPWSLVSAQTCWLRDRLCPQARIVSETEQNVDKQLVPPFEQFRADVLRRADWVVGRSAEAIEIVRRKGYQGPATVVPNAVDADLFRVPSPAARAQTRAALGWGEEFVCGYVGRLVEEKGLADLVDAIAQTPASPTRAPMRAVLVGSGPFEAPLRAQIGALGLAGRVELLPARGREELALLMGALDALVLPSRTTARWKEQFGRVLIEAQACGVPVVGSSSGAIPDVVGEAGLVFAEGDAAQLAQKLEWLAEHPTRGEGRWARAGARIVEAKYTWARVAQQMERIYREAVQTPPRANRSDRGREFLKKIATENTENTENAQKIAEGLSRFEPKRINFDNLSVFFLCVLCVLCGYFPFGNSGTIQPSMFSSGSPKRALSA